MPRTVFCQVLKQEAEGLDRPPFPGELGQRVFENISREGWQQWLQRLVPIINEGGLSTADVESVRLIEEHMRGFLFGEGEMGQLPPGFSPQRKK